MMVFKKQGGVNARRKAVEASSIVKQYSKILISMGARAKKWSEKIQHVEADKAAAAELHEHEIMQAQADQLLQERPPATTKRKE
jgi:hypothetical protein